jgi:SAM-dependent methyltransferase
MHETQEQSSTWWEHHYDEPGYIGDYFRKRLKKALMWMDESRICKQGALIFDAGCGGGQFVVQAALQGYRMVGMDYSLGMLMNSKDLSQRQALCKKRFFQGDIERMPVRDGSVDGIVCLGVISYLPSECQVLPEFARALRPGGMLILSATNRARLIKRLDVPQMFLSLERKVLRQRNSGDGISPNKLEDFPQRSYWIPAFFHSLDEAGFDVQDLVTLPYDLPTFFGREFLPRRVSERIAELPERLRHIPVVESLGSMWMVKARKR